MIKRETRVQIVIIENSQFIMLKHYQKDEDRYFWGIPGGGVEEGETPVEAALREAYEETGLEIQLLPYQKARLLPDNHRFYRRTITFIGYPIRGLAKAGYDPEPDLTQLFGLVELKWFSLFDLDKMDDYTRNDLLPVIDYVKDNPLTKRSGVLVYRKQGMSYEFLVLHRKNQTRYIIPQGHVEIGETLEEAAIRETREEAGVVVDIKKELGFFFHQQDEEFVQTTVFLGEFIEDCDQEDDRIKEWKKIDEVKNLEMMKESQRFFKELWIDQPNVVWGTICDCGQEVFELQSKYHPWVEKDILVHLVCKNCGKTHAIDYRQATDLYNQKIFTYFQDVNGKVLDFGCGGGFLTQYVKSLPSVMEVVGLDSDQRVHESITSLGCTLIHGSIEDLESLMDHFRVDYMVSRDVLMFIEDSYKFVQVVRDTVESGFRFMGWFIPNHLRMKNQLTPEDWKWAFRNVGFKVEVEYLDWYKQGYFIKGDKIESHN